MTTLLEDPTPILVVGILVIAGLGIALLRTGRGLLMILMLGVAILTGIGLLVERVVVTDREEVESVIDAAAASVRANDMAGVLAEIDPSASEARRLVQWAFKEATFEDAKVTHLDIRVIRTTSPPMAKAVLKGYVRCRVKRLEYPYEVVPIDGTLEFRLQNGRWMLTGYTMPNDPRG
jgi:hypothetical protein